MYVPHHEHHEVQDSSDEQEIKELSLSWHRPTLGGDCPHCGEWQDWQDENEKSGDGWHFSPMKSYSEKELGVGEGWETIFKCKDCKKECVVALIEW